MYISTVEDNICLWQNYFVFIFFFLKSRVKCLNYSNGQKCIHFIYNY